MASLNMNRFYRLTNEKIEDVILQNSPGNYALGAKKKDENTFIVQHVGRADKDVGERLKSWVDDYERFKFSYANSAKDAFEKECTNYHDFRGKEILDNENHPDRPTDKSWKCPMCNIFG